MKATDLFHDKHSLREYSTDFGNLRVKEPVVVAKPSSVSSLRDCFEHAHSHNLRITFKGGGQSFCGQSLCGKGMVIDMQAMLSNQSQVELGDGWVRVPAGMLLYDLQNYLRQRGLRLPVYTSATKATVGGTIASGGISGRSFSRGLLANHVLEIELMGSDGRIWLCNENSNADIFFGSLGTLGLGGAILFLKLQTEKLLPYRIQMIVKDSPFDSLVPLSGQLSRITEVVSMEGFIKPVSGKVTVDVYCAMEAAGKSELDAYVQKWREIARNLTISSPSIRTVHIDDDLDFSASLGGWNPSQQQLKMSLLNKKLGVYAVPLPLTLSGLKAADLIARYSDFIGRYPHFFMTRPYFAVIDSMKSSQCEWLRLSTQESHVIGMDLFVTFPHPLKNQGIDVLNDIALMAAEEGARIYPYGYIPDKALLTRLLPASLPQLKAVSQKTDPGGLIQSVLASAME
ncbi:MAG: FAD-dependent oxidoreductase [Gammaproteobacteria bacterium]|jgi:hypothetical protein